MNYIGRQPQAQLIIGRKILRLVASRCVASLHHYPFASPTHHDILTGFFDIQCLHVAIDVYTDDSDEVRPVVSEVVYQYLEVVVRALK